MSKNIVHSMLLMVLVSASAQASTITFDAHPTDFSSPIFDSGYRFDFTASGWGVFGPASGACCGVNYNGTPSLFADGDLIGPAFVDMTVQGGGTFSLSALDASVYWTGASGTLNLIGTVLGGGTVTTSFNVNSTWQSFLLPSTFTNLVNLRFQDSQSGQFLSAPGFGIDNLNDTPVPSAVPEPTSLILLGTGLAAAAVVRYRHRR